MKYFLKYLLGILLGFFLAASVISLLDPHFRFMMIYFVMDLFETPVW